jgi:hypothetical protein
MVKTQEFLDEFKERLASCVNESEVRAAFRGAAEAILDIRDWRQERGDSDLARNHVIFEFKNKGLFRGTSTSAKFAEAYKKLIEKYIPDKATEDGEPLQNYIGVALDGLHMAFVFFEENGLPRHTVLVEVAIPTLSVLIEYLERDMRRALTPENFIEDFGPDSARAHRLLRELWDHLNDSLNKLHIPKTTMLFSEWQKLFAQATSLGHIGKTRIDAHLDRVGIPIPADHTRALFVLHTYNSILFSLMAAELVATLRFTLGNSGFLLQRINESPATLQSALDRQIEHSEFFRDHGIRNFIEGTFFSWYLVQAPDSLMEALREILVRLVQYSFPTSYSPRVRDLIRRVYEDLVPEALRKNIGEFYTPEWLVEFVLDRLGYCDASTLGRKLLDPTCGSGNFLIHAIHRYREAGMHRGVSPQEILRQILNNIAGFDLSPLAVVAARTNYLLAIADLLTTRDVIEIPVFLADAVYAPTLRPSQGKTGKTPTTRVYSVGTLMGNIDLELPEHLVQKKDAFEAVLDIMESDAASEVEPRAFVRHLRTEPHLRRWRPYLHDSLKYLADMYTKILVMEKLSWNRLWCRIVRNYFASVAMGKFHFIAGNPPWVRWSELPETYRQTIKPTCDTYNIFSSTPFFGGNELDISGMISYTVTDKWLEPGGKLGFVITQIHFQAPSSEGFRRFQLPDRTHLRVEQVDDWTQVRPWGTKLANKPAVFVWIKGRATSYPVPYYKWRRKGSRVIQMYDPWNHVAPHLIKEDLAAVAIPPDSRWSILPSKLLPLIRRLSGGSAHYQGRKGIVTDLNGAYFVRVLGASSSPRLLHVENQPNMGRKPVPSRRFDIERSLLYPLLKGAGDFERFHPHNLNLCVIVPNRRFNRFLSSHRFQGRYGYAYRYFSQIRSLLEDRSTYRTRMKLMGAPLYAIYDIGPYTFASYKVVWAEQAGRIEAAVFSKAPAPHTGFNRVILPDHKVFFLGLDSREEAHYICALLNSEIVSQFVNSFTIKIQVGTLFKHLRLPVFDTHNAKHQALARLSILAHKVGINPYLQGQINTLAEQVI